MGPRERWAKTHPGHVRYLPRAASECPLPAAATSSMIAVSQGVAGHAGRPCSMAKLIVTRDAGNGHIGNAG